MTTSMLRNVTSADIEEYPFYHSSIQNILPDEVYSGLHTTFPQDEILSGESKMLSDEWKNFTKYHLSAEFLQEIFRTFGDCIRSIYPLEEVLNKPLEEITAGKRGDKTADIHLDMSFRNGYTYTPRRLDTGRHVDSASKIFTMLMYFREDLDDSIGGDFELCRAKDEKHLHHRNFIEEAWRIVSKSRRTGLDARKGRIIKVHERNCVRYNDVDVVKKIPYAANTGILFVNYDRSIHGVTERSATKYPRRVIYWNAMLADERPMFHVQTYESRSLWRKACRQLHLDKISKIGVPPL